ncbi:MAG: Xaa-Pro aminopeptidase [Saprospiraceae bacterium]|nr:Xaa-Pro aminopeptidase [Saprospiraceae bacterium]
MDLFEPSVYNRRRETLMHALPDSFILLLGNDYTPKNYTDNTFHFRQDSSFLFYGGHALASMAMIIDSASGRSELFGQELSIDDIVWTGDQPTLIQLGERIGVDAVRPISELMSVLNTAQNSERRIHYLPVYQGSGKIKLSEWLGCSIKEMQAGVSEELTRAVVDQRSVKELEELKEIEDALVISKEMHLEVMYETWNTKTEADLVGSIMQIACSHGVDIAYPPILTVNGHILHNHHHHHDLQDGQMVLGDFGAESSKFYASDITRTVPVAATFSETQREIYSIVLDALETAALGLKPNVPFLEVHMSAARTIAQGLKDLGLMRGDIEEAIAEGAHALFFVHGLGHMLGLDVHDMEGLGEANVGYGENYKRSKQFGLKSLRLARELEPGFVFTIEPGIYFIPALIDQWQAEKKCEAFINYQRVEKYREFTGIRIEDNYAITKDGAKLLGPNIPRQLHEIEFLRASQLDLQERIRKV